MASNYGVAGEGGDLTKEGETIFITKEGINESFSIETRSIVKGMIGFRAWTGSKLCILYGQQESIKLFFQCSIAKIF
jgi:hypothetical protein